MVSKKQFNPIQKIPNQNQLIKGIADYSSE